MDLRAIARLTEGEKPASAILAPYAAKDEALAVRIAALRAAGHIVVELLPGEAQGEGPLCDRRLVQENGHWIIQAINGD